MADPRIAQLAETIVDYSLAVEQGNKVLIEWSGSEAYGLVQTLIQKIAARGAMPFWNHTDDPLMRALVSHADESQLAAFGRVHRGVMEQMDCYVAVRGSGNIFEMSSVSDERRSWYMKHYMQPVHLDCRIKKTRWVVLRYPNPAMAQLAERSTEEFADFYFKSVLIDYAKLDKAMIPLKALMEKTDRVHIKSPGTDLRLSIKEIPAVPCNGRLNIPDGEVFTAPVRDSINGTIFFNASTPYMGKNFRDVRLTFRDGKVVEATCEGKADQLNKILDTDDGARYVGEFAIGFHPWIREPMQDILFDEKIAGSLHLALGNAYDYAPNGNKSAIHWDLVSIQRPEWGGGEIYFDDTLIRKDGQFVLKELEALNPEAWDAEST